MSSVRHLASATVSPERSVENVSTGPVGCWRTGMAVTSSAITEVTREPVMKLMRSTQWVPMSPNARSVPPCSGIEPPVPVGVQEQPVLEVAAGDQPDVAQLAVAHGAVEMLVERVEADVVVDGGDAVARGREPDQLRGLRGGHRERLLAHHVAAGGQDRLDLGVVELVGRRDVDDVHARVGEQLVQAAHTRAARPAASARVDGPLGGGAEDAVDRDAQAAERLHVDRADEAGADDGRADVDGPSPRASSLRVACSNRRITPCRIRTHAGLPIESSRTCSESIVTSTCQGQKYQASPRCGLLLLTPRSRLA